MDQRQEYLREQFLASLQQLVDQGTEMIGESGVVSILEETVAELGGTVVSSDGDNIAVERTSRFSDADGKAVLTLSYPSVEMLKADIDTLTNVRGLMVELSQTPPLMKAMAIDIEIEGSDQSARLGGRAVHASNDGVAIELFPAEKKQKQQLQALVALEDDDATEMTSPIADSTRADAHSNGIPAVDRLVETPDDVARRWALQGTDLNAMLLEVATIDGYGFLEFECSESVRQYIIHYGKLIDVRTTPLEDSEALLIDKLEATGHIDGDDVERADVLANIHGIPRQDALVDMGCMTLEELLDAIKARLVDEFHRIWDLDADEARLYLLQHRPPLRLRRSSIDLAEQVARRIQIRVGRLAPDQLEAAKSRFGGQQLSSPHSPDIEWARFGFDDDRQRFAEVLLAEPRSLSDLERISHLRRHDTLRMLLVLDELDLLERCESKSRLPEHYEIEGLYERAKDGNHFDVLGVHWSAHGEELKRAYDEIRDTLDVPESVEEDLAEKLRKLRHITDEAYRVLSDRGRRRKYRNERIDRFARKSVIEVYEKKADSLRMRGEGKQLVDCLRRILELNPRNRQAQKELKALTGD